MVDQPYEFDARRGDTLEVEVAEQEVVAQVADVRDHGYYRELTVLDGERELRLRLFRDEADRRHSPVIRCRLLRRRDWRRVVRYNLD